MGALESAGESLDDIGLGSLTPGTLTSVFDPLDHLGTYGGQNAKEAADDAAEEQERAAAEAKGEVRSQFDKTREDFRVARETGDEALQQQRILLGLGGNEAQQQAMQGLEESAGQKFIRERAQKNLVRNAGAIGGLGGGNVRSALVEQGAGFAQQDIQNQFGRLGQLAGQGQSAATSVGQFGSTAATNQANLTQFAGQARASGILGKQQVAAQQQQGINQLVGTVGGAIFGSDSRIKTDIIEVGRDELGGIYEFRYLWDNIRYRGRMAQELIETRPESVDTNELGYYLVTEEFAPEAITCH